MQARILGPVDVVDEDGIVVALRGPMPTRLLALLIAARPRPVSVEELTARLWEGVDLPEDPVASLRTYVARVRSVLGGESIMTGSGSYSIGEVDTDAYRFEELVTRARQASGSPAVADLWSQALDLWRGQAFGELAGLESVQAESARLDELRAEATEAWIDARLAGGEGREIVADVNAAVAEFPFREGFRAQQMTVLARAGRQADALRAFQQFRADLTEIGLEPSQRVVEIEQQIASGAAPSAGARRTIRGYELGDRLGQGAFAIVHLATQSSVGRDVAVKQIRGSLADQPEFIRQFEAEAHLVARLEHPNIVPLYDYWREPGSAYLVMRYLDGGTLGRRILDESVPLEQLLSQVDQVAAALDEAHRAGVVHRDVKPANILLDRSGNAYLSDFGIAVEEAERVDPEAWLSNGSPAYAPPEQLRREPVGPRADIFALGVTVYEALTGRLPFPGENTMAGLLARQLSEPIPLVRTTRPEFPAAIDTVIQKATAKAPEDRYDTASEFARELAAAAGLEGVVRPIEPEDRNPYKGLSAFDEADAGDFAGRDRLVGQLVDAVADHRTLVVVGPSGSGKSSAVRAGLLPAIRQGRIRGSERWFLTTMIPGADPFADLESALLRVAVDPPADLHHLLSGDPRGLAKAVDRLVPSDRELVLVIDQSEELFTLTGEENRHRFLDALVEAVTVERTRLRIVATLRADFYDHPLRHPAFAQLIREATVPVHPLAADELERAITEPARAVGATFEPGLVAAITADVADQPGSLPLLQYALTELFDRRVEHQLTKAAYTELGGVAGALARRAEDVYGRASTDEQLVARRIFGRLVNLGEGTEDTRRRALRTEVVSSVAAESVVESFGAARLLAFDRDRTSREPTVEVAHESLIREWPRLRAWLDEDRDGLRTHLHLARAAAEWDAAGRPESELYRGGRLESAEEWAATADTLPPIESAFLDAGVARRTAAETTERTRTRRLQGLLGAVAVVAVLAVLAGTVALVQRNQADEARDDANEQRAEAEAAAVEAGAQRALAESAAEEADLRRMAADAINLRVENPSLALLLAAAVHRERPDVLGSGALQRVMALTDGFLGSLGPDRSYSDVKFAGDDHVVASVPGGAEIWDLDSRKITHTIETPDTAAIATDDTTVYLLEADGTLSRHDAEGAIAMAEVATGLGGDLALAAGPDGLAIVGDDTVIFFSPDLGELGRVELVPPAEDEPRLPAAITVAPRGAIVSRGVILSRLASDGSVIWESDAAVSDELFRDLPEQWQAGLYYDALGASPDGSVVYGIITGLGTFSFDAEDGTFLEHWPGLTEALGEGGKIAVGDGLVLAGQDVIDLTSGEVRRLAAEAEPAGFSALSPDGTVAALGGSTGISLWSVDGDQLLAEAIPARSPTFAALNADGTSVSWLDFSTSTFGLWDLVSDEPIEAELGENPVQAYWLPSGALGTWEFSGESRVWDPDTFEEIGNGIPPQTWTMFMTTPDPRYAVVADHEPNLGRIRVLDLVTGGEVAVIDDLVVDGNTVDGATVWADFSPDGSLMAVTRINDVPAIIDTAKWTVIRTIASPDGSRIATAAFNGDGSRLALHTERGRIFFYDIDNDRFEEGPIAGEAVNVAMMHATTFSPGNETLVVGLREGVQLWDLASKEQIGGLFPNEGLLWGSASFDGRFGLTSTGDNVLVWNLDSSTWADVACRAAGRDMTPEEWAQYGITDREFTPICPS